MKLPLPPLLAETDWTKLIGGLVFVLFWVISAVIGQIANKKQEEERRRRAEEIRRQEAMNGGRPAEELPPVLAESLPGGGTVQTRQEMERRIEAARNRRASEEAQVTMGGALPGGLEPREQASMSSRSRDSIELRRQESMRGDAPVQADREGVLQDAQHETRRRYEAEAEQREAAMREQEKRRQAQERETRRLDAARRKAEERARQIRRSNEAPARALPSTAAIFSSESDPVRQTVATAAFEYNAASPSAGDRPSVADAATIRKWATPAKLRQQYILTEIFSPPVALRPDREGQP